MGADVDTLQAQSGNRGAALNREGIVLREVSKSEPQFILQVGANRIIVRDQEAAILVVGHYVRQEFIRQQSARAFTGEQILPAIARVDLLFRREVLVAAEVPAIRARRNRHQSLVVIRLIGYVWQGIILQQRGGHGIDAPSSANAGWNRIVRERRPREGVY